MSTLPPDTPLMKIFERIEPADPIPEPQWKPDRPLDRALLASSGQRVVVLASCGPAAEYMQNVDHPDIWFEEIGFDAGLWVVEFKLRSYSYDTDVGREHDEELVIVTDRHATEEEASSAIQGAIPWDLSLWMSTETD